MGMRREEDPVANRTRLSLSLKALRKIQSSDDIEAVVADMRGAYCFAHITFLVVRLGISPEVHPFFCTTYPVEWTDTYLRKNYFEIDPVMEISRAGFLPVDWAGLDRRSARTYDFFKEARSFGVGRHGLSISVRGTNGERCLFSVTSDLSRRDWLKLRTSSIHDLQILSHCLHEKVLSVSGLRSSGRYEALSRREQQCVQLLARGLVAKRIAARLQISESAVRLYLRSAKRKLGAATIYQAMARASFLEIIQV